jgi:hypothetical protein
MTCPAYYSPAAGVYIYTAVSGNTFCDRHNFGGALIWALQPSPAEACDWGRYSVQPSIFKPTTITIAKNNLQPLDFGLSGTISPLDFM